MASEKRLLQKLEAARKSTARAREKAGEVMETAVTTAVSGGAAFALGVWEGRTSDPKQFEFFGVPAPLAIGIAAHGAALFGVGRGMERHFRALGDGALASHLNGIGRQTGAKWASRGELSGDAPASLPPSRRGAGITEADLANALAR